MHGSYKPGQTVFDSPDDFDSWDRCITRGMPVSMLPRNYNNGIRIMQSPGYVLILLEMAHEVRIIPTDGRPALDNSIKEWLGESRGHWEGNTLVVETTNFNGKGGSDESGVPGSPPLTPTFGAASVSRSGSPVPTPDTIEFRCRVEDPDVVVSPFAVAYPDEAGQQVSDVRIRVPRRECGDPRLYRELAFRAGAPEAAGACRTGARRTWRSGWCSAAAAVE